MAIGEALTVNKTLTSLYLTGALPAHACAWGPAVSSHSVHVCALLMQGVHADTARMHMLCV